MIMYLYVLEWHFIYYNELELMVMNLYLLECNVMYYDDISRILTLMEYIILGRTN